VATRWLGAPARLRPSAGGVRGSGPARGRGPVSRLSTPGRSRGSATRRRVSFSTGERFDAPWDGGRPFTFTLGAGEVIPGCDRGIAGMRKGGRRKLTIPPEMATGLSALREIATNETPVFIVDFVAIE
jgi:hypothetical protein